MATDAPRPQRRGAEEDGPGAPAPAGFKCCGQRRADPRLAPETNEFGRRGTTEGRRGVSDAAGVEDRAHGGELRLAGV